MSDSTDPSHPDYVWPGGDRAASKNEIANAVAHIKAWITRELATVGVNLPAAMVAETAAPEPAPVPVPAPVSEQPAADEAGAEQASMTDAPRDAAASAGPDATSANVGG